MPSSPELQDGKDGLQALIRQYRPAIVTAVPELFDILDQFQQQGSHPVLSVVQEGPQPFTQFAHYPEGDVDDTDTGYAWYYHAHAPCETRPWQEHGHFHCYAYTEIVPTGSTPVALPQQPDPVAGGLIHLIALCVNDAGVPCRLFTINRWASDEWLYPAPLVATLANRFHLNHPRHQLTSRWLSVMLRILRPYVEWLLLERDRAIFPHHPDWSMSRSEDAELEITSTIEFALDEYLRRVGA